jgi:hypothetical protein
MRDEIIVCWYLRPIDEDDPMAIKLCGTQRGVSFLDVSSHFAVVK